jgi:oxygen-dependent protoporphyrinogen oxidase
MTRSGDNVKDVVVVGGGWAGLAAAWRLRHWDTVLLESDTRLGGRTKSERRGRYWLNWGGHILAGPGSSTDALLKEVGVTAIPLPGSLKSISMRGKFIPNGHVATYPSTLPLSLPDRIRLLKAGVKVVAGVARYTAALRPRPGESAETRQQRIYDFEDRQTFQDFIGDLPTTSRSCSRSS